MDTTPEQKVIIEALGKPVVGAIAPAELPLYDVMSRAFLEAPERARPQREGKEENLGFGLGEVVLLTPVVLAAAANVATLVLDELLKSMEKMTAQYVAEQIRKLIRREPAALHFDEAQLARIRRGVLETAHQYRMPDAKAALLADTLVGHLAGRGAVEARGPE
jgi:hypothetical protein